MLEIIPDFDMNEIDKDIDAELVDWFDDLVETYREAGKTFVDTAVEKANFNNITWNLRSSIGYVIIYNGEVLESYFKDLVKGTEGQEAGKDYAELIARFLDEGEGLAMALVAGEEYAYYVQARDGFDVIDGSYIHFETELKTAFG